ncbi:DUF6085 family protein [Micromonospora sp. NPDC003944]
MTEKPYTDADIAHLTAAVRARIGWPISAGEAGTIVTVVLQELATTGRLAPVDDDPRHIIEFRPAGWTIKHPLACRPNLFACPFNRAALALDSPPAKYGRYVVDLSDEGVSGDLVVGDRIGPVEG